MGKRKTKQNLNSDTQLDYLFRKGVNLRGRVLTLTGEVEDSLFRVVDAALSEFEARSRKPITIRINSFGGSTYDALAIAGRIRKSKCRVITEGYGAVMSAATLILSSGSIRRISRMAWFMTHECSYEINGRHSEMQEYVAQVEREQKEWVRWMAEFTGQPADFWREAGKKKDTYFGAEELLKLGVVDSII